jgi:hypothetical protein
MFSVSQTPPLSVCETTPAVQREFLTQCLRQLVLTRQPTGAVYILAMRWISMASAAVGGGSDVGSAAGLKDATRDRYVVLRPQHVVDLVHTRT